MTESATGSTGSNRVRTTLTIKVEDIDFDTQACMLRLKGRNIQENQYVKVCIYPNELSFYFYLLCNQLFISLYRWEHTIL